MSIQSLCSLKKLKYLSLLLSCNTSLWGFSGGSGKETACQCTKRKRHGFTLRVRKIPWSRKQQPTPILLPGKSHGQRSLAAYSPWGRKELEHSWAHEHKQTKKSHMERPCIDTTVQLGVVWALMLNLGVKTLQRFHSQLSSHLCLPSRTPRHHGAEMIYSQLCPVKIFDSQNL